jgi:hypothetical protein
MFTVTYLPQAALMALINGPLAIISAITLVLSESSAITNILARSFFIGDALVDTFDGTLVACNATETVTQGREVRSASAGDPIARLGRTIKTPFASFTPRAVVRYLMYLPFNAIPFIGTAIFVYLQAKRFGPGAHARYFQLKGLSERQKEEFVERRRAAYTRYVEIFPPIESMGWDVADWTRLLASA